MKLKDLINLFCENSSEDCKNCVNSLKIFDTDFINEIDLNEALELEVLNICLSEAYIQVITD